MLASSVFILSAIVVGLFLLSTSELSAAFQNTARGHRHAYRRLTLIRAAEPTQLTASDEVSFTVRAAELDKSLGLTDHEKNVVNVHRLCSPSVAYVTSIAASGSTDERRRRAGLPRGRSLGSGSGFVVDSSGYLVTNYHVVQRAYELNELMSKTRERLGVFANTTFGEALSGRSSGQVFVRFGSDEASARYLSCDIVGVAKELDLAVLKINGTPESPLKALSFGSSSALLVGQTTVACGNPFGLDKTLTSGIVSALGRSVTGVAGNEIKNCIQTDTAINPGNSGGPLLNLDGMVVGVNTMIVTTSGSNAGIGFAVPSDAVKENTSRIIEMDKRRQAKGKRRGRLGMEVALTSLEATLAQRLEATLAERVATDRITGAFVTSIASDSPLQGRGVKAISLADGCVSLGDRVVNVGGNRIENGQQFLEAMSKRVEGEKIDITLENAEGVGRVVYVELAPMPLA
mmetsp:Transcript_26843/g.61313  ORF Transcript_26843/g.61313 Transcript_26843/m.61313 type:complete len:460 (-) Transcript_26843:83-1462(-)